MGRINLFRVVPHEVEVDEVEEYWTDLKSFAVKNKKRISKSLVVYKLYNLKTGIRSQESYLTEYTAEQVVNKILLKYSDYELGCLSFQLNESLNNEESDEFKRGYGDEVDFRLKQIAKDNFLDALKRQKEQERYEQERTTAA